MAQARLYHRVLPHKLRSVKEHKKDENICVQEIHALDRIAKTRNSTARNLKEIFQRSNINLYYRLATEMHTDALAIFPLLARRVL